MKNKKRLTIAAGFIAALMALVMLTACGAAPYQARFDYVRAAFEANAAWTVETFTEVPVGVGDNVVTATSVFSATNASDIIYAYIFSSSSYAETAHDYLRYNAIDGAITFHSGNIVFVGTNMAIAFATAALASHINCDDC